MSLPAYPSYHSTGSKWLGNVPSHWARKRFKQVFRERKERSASGEEELLSVSAYTGVRPRRESTSEGDHLSRADSLEGYKRCYPADLVMNIMLAWNRGLGFSQYEGIVSPAYCVFSVVDDSDPRFLDYLVRSDDYIGYFKSFSAGVIDSRLRLYPDAFLSLPVALPLPPEQRSIAAFLDGETAKIDALVEEQRRLIELLQEKRLAVISHAVTKGLDPTAPMKDSGVEWLREVPAHWTVLATKRTVSLVTSGPRGWSDLTSEDGALFFQSQNIGRNMQIDLTDAKRIDAPFGPDADRAKLKAGDVVVCITGGRTGAVASATDMPEDCYVNQHVCLLRPISEIIEGRFLAYVLSGRVGQEQLAVSMYGLKQGLGLEDIRQVTIALPTIAEQRAVADFLDDFTAQTDRLAAYGEGAIALLQEHRAALISAAVTGRIDVRCAAVEQAEAA
ncbi:MAG: EcoKI restriction-modification system protein HsdS [Alphaproteobacteria bacterium]|nr:EcoKI restriction-modification system protein HsdS [Alphaproteobacteria bacterium]